MWPLIMILVGCIQGQSLSGSPMFSGMTGSMNPGDTNYYQPYQQPPYPQQPNQQPTQPTQQQQPSYPPIILKLLSQIGQDSDFQKKIGESLQSSQLYSSFDDFIQELSSTALNLPMGDPSQSALNRILRLFYISNPNGDGNSNLLSTAWFGSWVQDFLKSWFSFLDSPYSALALEAKLNKTDYKKDSVTPASGFLSFDQYYTRAFLDSRRPVDSDVNSLISPVDGCITEVVDISTNPTLSIQGFNVNVMDFFSKSQTKINNGTAVHFELDNNGYHRIHVPWDGVISEIIEIPGDVKANLTKNSNGNIVATDGNRFTFKQSRCMLSLQTKFGLISIIGVGLVQVGSCKFLKFNNGESLKKGNTIGRLSFGGNDVIVVFDSQFKGNVSNLEVGKCWKKGEKIVSLSNSSESSSSSSQWTNNINGQGITVETQAPVNNNLSGGVNPLNTQQRK